MVAIYDDLQHALADIVAHTGGKPRRLQDGLHKSRVGIFSQQQCDARTRRQPAQMRAHFRPQDRRRNVLGIRSGWLQPVLPLRQFIARSACRFASAMNGGSGGLFHKAAHVIKPTERRKVLVFSEGGVLFAHSVVSFQSQFEGGAHRLESRHVVERLFPAAENYVANGIGHAPLLVTATLPRALSGMPGMSEAALDCVDRCTSAQAELGKPADLNREVAEADPFRTKFVRQLAPPEFARHGGVALSFLTGTLAPAATLHLCVCLAVYQLVDGLAQTGDAFELRLLQHTALTLGVR